MKKLISLPDFIMITLTTLFCIYGIGFAERIQVREGGGWDGNAYVYYAQELPRLLDEKEVDRYYFSRFFPSVVVRGMMEVYSFSNGIKISELSKATVINFFSIWVALCIVGSVWLMLDIFKGHNTKVRWCVWGILLSNFFILKMTFFYPTLTDMTAFFLSCLLLWAYKKNANIIYWIACILGFFTHPLLFYSAMVLWVFNKEETRNLPAISFANKWNVIFIALVLAGLFVKFILVIQNRPLHVREATYLLLPLSISLTLGYVAYLLYMSNPYDKFQRLLNVHAIKRLAIAVCVWGTMKWLLISFSSSHSGTTYREFLHYMIYDAISDPVIFLVAHIVYFGLGVLVLIFVFSDIRIRIEQESLGLQIVFWGSLLFAINSESRQIVIFWPLMVYLMAAPLAGMLNGKRYVWIVGIALSLLWSRFWLILQPVSYGSEIENYIFPQQLYFMHHGPWMIHQMYLIQLFLILLIAGLLYVLWKFLPSTVRSNQDSSY